MNKLVSPLLHYSVSIVMLFGLFLVIQGCATTSPRTPRAPATPQETPKATSAPQSTPTSTSEEWSVLGAMQILKEPPPAGGQYFRCNPVDKLHVGDQISTAYSRDSKVGWSVRTESVPVGNSQRAFPFVGSLEISDGSHHFLLLSLVTALKAIPKGKILEDGEYRIMAHRNITEGEVLAAYAVGDSDPILTLEAVSEQSDTGQVVEVPAMVISKQPTTLVEAADSRWMDLWRGARGASSAMRK